MTKQGSSLKRKKRRLSEEERQQAARFKQAGSGPCVVCNARGTEAHHVIEAQFLRREHPELVYAPELAVPTCRRCHARHTSAFQRIPRELLPTAVEAFAAEHGLSWYLNRYYPRSKAA